MALSKVTSKGQVTIPKPIRDALGLEPGDRVDFRLSSEGEVVMEAATIDLMSLYATLQPSDKSLTLEDMDDAIAEGARGRR